MLRFLTVGMVLLTILSASGLYAVTFQTRVIAHDLEADQKRAATLKRNIATLKAERAFLARPEHIEPAARALGMRPARGDQFVIMPARANPAKAAQADVTHGVSDAATTGSDLPPRVRDR